MLKKTNKKNKGFSLVELIIVIAIMAILAGVLVPQFSKYIGNSRVTSDLNNAQSMADAISAQIAGDAAAGTSVITLPATGESTPADVSTIGAVVGTAAPVATKVNSAATFYYSVDENGNVKIYAHVSATNNVQLVPTVEAGSDWDK